MRKIFEFLLSRLVIFGFLLFFQVIILLFIVWQLAEAFIYIYIPLLIISGLVVIYIISRRDNPSYKLAWTIPVLIFPIFGGLIYLIFGGKKINLKFRKKIARAYNEAIKVSVQDPEIIKELEKENKHAANQAKYTSKYALSPVYKNTTTEYLSPGEKFFERLLEELEKAEKYIFMEYFIIHEGKMWDAILEVLERKVKEGVDVRMLYDDVGCLRILPYRYDEVLRKKGIKCHVFNRFVPFLSVILNNRDHRKITVIDGHTGFTGGINLADEYINEIVRFGHWKDSSIMLKGEAVWNLTVMFLQMWSYESKTKVDYEKFKPQTKNNECFIDDGYVQPYGDSPLDEEIVGENIYLGIITKAKDYVYINTPYLIIDNELVTALTLAAKSGVDVRIVTPHIEDKWYVHMLTRSYYPQLIESGVKIYEYTPGFIHSKTVVSDDEVATVGSINFDYRSLYLHFECGVWLYKTKSVLQIKEDYLETLKICTPITLEMSKDVSWLKKIVTAVFRVFAPLM
ncbi:cardiolipin synthase [Clostridium thermobutyricum]|uniref:Cardiolipin synthase n=1 Tax=Clostridium thermobutyricum DSM 4928 TaxID=1121339 RepID=A0A1V4SU39_9CLOT|nr:cardiolipin synthase [Clostridium thermobutyricum]OPX47381.1 major cardiolipin synthase ClsA [Clostridium thermobutyricum DSM 4928]